LDYKALFQVAILVIAVIIKKLQSKGILFSGSFIDNVILRSTSCLHSTHLHPTCLPTTSLY